LFRVGLRKRCSLEVPLVISVGNVAVGGTGKTPMVDYIVRSLLKLSLTPAVLTRGYGNDEHICLQKKFPEVSIGVGSNRVASFRNINVAVDAVVLDDGLQHFSLERDVDILMINAVTGVDGSYGNLLPLGALRESYSDGLERANIVVLHHSNLVSDHTTASLERYLRSVSNADFSLFHSYLEPISLESVEIQSTSGKTGFSDFLNRVERNQTLGVFCGIGDSSQFFMSMENLVRNQLGLTDVALKLFEYGDHHVFSNNDMRALLQQECSIFITTQKDYQRTPVCIRRWLHGRCFIVDSELRVHDEPAFTRAILKKK